MTIQIQKVNTTTGNNQYIMYGTKAERLALDAETKEKMAAGSYFVETDATGAHDIYMWDETAKDWGLF